MKKVVLSTIAAVLMVLGLSGVATMSPAYAVTCANGNNVSSLDQCPEWDTNSQLSKGNLMETLQLIINVVVGIVGFVAVVMIIMGGISFVTSQGDSSKVAKARNTILYGVVGLIVVLLAFAIVNFVLTNVFKK